MQKKEAEEKQIVEEKQIEVAPEQEIIESGKELNLKRLRELMRETTNQFERKELKIQ